MPTKDTDRIVPTWVLISAACFAFAAIAEIPYGYYRLLRWVICGVAIFSALQLQRASLTGWVWVFSLLAVLFNPLIPFHFDRITWQIFDGAAGCLFLAVVYLGERKREEPNH